jgi:hypothetical protein
VTDEPRDIHISRIEPEPSDVEFVVINEALNLLWPQSKKQRELTNDLSWRFSGRNTVVPGLGAS